MDLALELQRAREREIDAAEAALTARLSSALPAPPELDNEIRRHLAPFVNWAGAAGVRYCPAKPAIVAGYILSASAVSTSEETLLAQVQAISILHDHYGLADPTCTSAARAALDFAAVKTQPPRSWKADERATYLRLPADIRAVVIRRDREGELALRRKQNELAEAIKEAKRPPDGAAKPVINGRETEMATKKKDEVVIERREDYRTTDSSKDISKRVENSGRSDGFSGPISVEK